MRNLFDLCVNSNRIKCCDYLLFRDVLLKKKIFLELCNQCSLVFLLYVQNILVKEIFFTIFI
jgi:hypothetical protein